jgi:predicted kinase
MPKVFIMVGIPGSGKSHYVAEQFFLDKHETMTSVSADEYFTAADGSYNFDPSKLSEAHGQCLRNFVESIQKVFGGRPLYDAIYVDNTNLSDVEIAPYYTVAKAYGYEVELVFFQTPLEVCLSRNTHNVPEHTMLRMKTQFVDFADNKYGLPRFWDYTRINVR